MVEERSLRGGLFDERLIYLPRQEVAFREECRKIKGFGSLREDFYTKFKPEN